MGLLTSGNNNTRRILLIRAHRLSFTPSLDRWSFLPVSYDLLESGLEPLNPIAQCAVLISEFLNRGRRIDGQGIGIDLKDLALPPGSRSPLAETQSGKTSANSCARTFG